MLCGTHNKENFNDDFRIFFFFFFSFRYFGRRFDRLLLVVHTTIYQDLTLNEESEKAERLLYRLFQYKQQYSTLDGCSMLNARCSMKMKMI